MLLEPHLNCHESLTVILSGTVSGSERTVDDGGHHGWTEDQQGPFLLPAGTSEAPQ